MNPFLRLGKFNLVGAMGMAVQLGALALFNRWLHGHYLVASAAALEVTLLHNFVWHVNYTWRDRYERAAWLPALLRFHISSGAVSMLGNLGLMRLLMHETRLPLLAANSIAICCCSLVNFSLGNAWAFAGAGGRITLWEAEDRAHATTKEMLGQARFQRLRWSPGSKDGKISVCTKPAQSRH